MFKKRINALLSLNNENVHILNCFPRTVQSAFSNVLFCIIIIKFTQQRLLVLCGFYVVLSFGLFAHCALVFNIKYISHHVLRNQEYKII